MPAAGDARHGALGDGLRRGDRDAVATLLREHGAALLTTARHLVGSDTDAVAVLGRACRIARTAGRQMPDGLAPHLWLRRLTVGVALEHLKHDDDLYEDAIEDLLPRFLPNGQHVTTFTPWPPTTLEDAGRNPLAAAARDRLSHMPSPFRTVLLLHDVEGVPVSDIAALLGVPPNGVVLRLHRARLAALRLLTPVVTGADS